MGLPATDLIEVTYRIEADASEIEQRAYDIALEQTVELPDQVVTDSYVRDNIIGKILDIQPQQAGIYHARIGYNPLCAAGELTQFLNLIFGNSCIKTGLKVIDLLLPNDVLSGYQGPRFGQAGLRDIFAVPDKPMLCTALKPMGKSSDDLAELAYQFALGGVDMIKDDHGLSNQSSAPYEERVEKCVAAIDRANRETGGRSVYVPNVTAGFDQIESRVRFAKQAGAGGLLIAPGLVGFDTLRWIAEQDDIALPIMAHPTLTGPQVINPSIGFSHRVFFGLLHRLAGADCVIYPNYGGRFGFSEQECQDIASACQQEMGHFKSIFPTPGGGMGFDKVAQMTKTYGQNVMYLMGGSLYGWSDDLTASTKALLEKLARTS